MADGHDHVDQSDTQDGDDGDRQENPGERQQDVDAAHGDLIEPPAKYPAAAPKSDPASDAPPTDATLMRSEIRAPMMIRLRMFAPQLIGAEQMAPLWGPKRHRQILPHRIVGDERFGRTATSTNVTTMAKPTTPPRFRRNCRRTVRYRSTHGEDRARARVETRETRAALICT